MIEQINIALEQKGFRNFSAWVIEACRRRLTSERGIYIKVMKNGIRVLPSEQDIVNSLNYRSIAVIELQFTTFLTVTDCVLALSQTK